jgi:hypothetical protein
MATRTKSSDPVDAEIVDEAAAPAVYSPKFDSDYSSLVSVIHELTPDQLAQIPALTIDGLQVVQKGWLLGVPFTVTGVTFWTPAADKTPSGYRTGYVSCEATIDDVGVLERQIARGRVLERNGDETRVVKDLDELAFYPGERVVFNDESTGIRRTIVGWLTQFDMVKIPDSHPKFEGNKLDMPWPLWDSFIESTSQGEGVIVPRFTRLPNGNPFLIRASRGLRVSEYSNSMTGNDTGVTYYFG